MNSVSPFCEYLVMMDYTFPSSVSDLVWDEGSIKFIVADHGTIINFN